MCCLLTWYKIMLILKSLQTCEFNKKASNISVLNHFLLQYTPCKVR